MLLGSSFDGVYSDEYILAKNMSSVNKAGGEFTFVIDAGHGGVDGGAVGINGVLEKDINLSLSFILADVLRVLGYNAVRTRKSDELLGEHTKGQMKLEDLRSRVDFVKKYENSVFISIHMNKYPEEYCKGLTVYYSPNDPESEELGKSIRESTLKYLQPNNKRPMKKATSALYVLNRATVPAVLVECGFLSNTEEAELLKTESYQKKLALTIACGIAQWSENK